MNDLIVGNITQLTDQAHCQACGAAAPMHQTWCKKIGRPDYVERSECERLRAENEALRVALRRVAVVGYELGVGTWCRVCHEWWLTAAPEKHKPDCLAAQEGER